MRTLTRSILFLSGFGFSISAHAEPDRALHALEKYNQYKEAAEFGDACYGSNAAQVFSEQADRFEAAKAKLRLKFSHLNEALGTGDTDYACHRTKGAAPNIDGVRRYARYLLAEFENAVKE